MLESQNTACRVERLTFLGTGAAMVTACYNSCFTLSDDDSPEHFLVDGGGGNGIFIQLQKANIDLHNIHNIFISHNHSDHILGIVWLVRMITQEINKNRYHGNLTIYGHKKSLDAIRTICGLVMQPKLSLHFDNRIIMDAISDNEQRIIDGRKFTFFDIGSVKELQHGFVCDLNCGKRFAFTGDEPISDKNRDILRGAHIILQEAYCVYEDVKIFNPYPKHHGTVKDSCQNAKDLGAETTILFHTEGKTFSTRKQRYLAEGRQYFQGNIFVPDDLEVIPLQ